MPVWPSAPAFGLFGKFIPDIKLAMVTSQVESGVRGYRQCSMDFESTVTPDRAPSIPTPTPPEAGGAGKNLMDTLPRAAARRLALPLGYCLIVLSGLRFALRVS